MYSGIFVNWYKTFKNYEAFLFNYIVDYEVFTAAIANHKTQDLRTTSL
ncbi:hypothetical protein [Fischerella thermalis]|nr:hypothetical protein [Fischerella thermalis]